MSTRSGGGGGGVGWREGDGDGVRGTGDLGAHPGLQES